MELLEFFGYIGALMVGVILGLMGGGGSIMTIPIMTYMFHLNPLTTTAYSLFVVGTSSSIGTLNNWKKGLIDYRIAFIFSIPAFLSVYAVRKYLLPLIPQELLNVNDFVITKDMVIMVLFAIIMLLAATSMIKKRKQLRSKNDSHNLNYPLIIFSGIGIGIITGIIGIGGGFLIIPVLVLLLHIKIEKAVATTLFIIAIKSLVGFLGDVGTTEINWKFLLLFTAISTIGILLGSYLSSFIKGVNLKKSFGWLIVLFSFLILYKEIFI